jgi:hypothetical protein
MLLISLGRKEKGSKFRIWSKFDDGADLTRPKMTLHLARKAAAVNLSGQHQRTPLDRTQ